MLHHLWKGLLQVQTFKSDTHKKFSYIILGNGLW